MAEKTIRRKHAADLDERKEVYYIMCKDGTEYAANDLTQVLKLWAEDGQREATNVGRYG